jgi:hypothetical protein
MSLEIRQRYAGAHLQRGTKLQKNVPAQAISSQLVGSDEETDARSGSDVCAQALSEASPAPDQC